MAIWINSKKFLKNDFLLSSLSVLSKIFKNNYRNIFLSIFFIFSLLSQAWATKQIQEVNYFSSLRANETNVRSGPGQNYPIKFTYKVKGVPVRVISEYDNWNEIEDYDGHTGWVTQSLLTKKRTLMVYSKKPTVELRRKKSFDAHLVYRLENFVIGEYVKCEDEWCIIKINGKKGWIEKADVFGVESQVKIIDKVVKIQNDSAQSNLIAKSVDKDQQQNFQIANSDNLKTYDGKLSDSLKNQVNTKNLTIKNLSALRR